MKQLVFLFVLLVSVILFAAWLTNPNNVNLLFANKVSLPQPPGIQKQEDVVPKYIQVGSSQFTVEVAKTESDRKTGLSGRTSLDEDSGMLFVFATTDVRPRFWMKDMKFPIDIIWIDNNKVVQISENIPILMKELPDDKIPFYVPRQPVDYVLEVTAGTAKNEGIKIGDSVELPQL